MLGLFGSLSLGQRALQTQRQAIEVAGQNLANVNNPVYSRQRLAIQSAEAISTVIGPQGSGVDPVSIRQLRDGLVDQQIQTEKSIGGFLDAKKQAFEFAEANLGQQIDRQASGPEASAASLGVGGQHGIAEGMSDLFSALHGVSSNPASLADRRNLITRAQDLTAKFNQVDQRMDRLETTLNQAVNRDVESANTLLEEIATLNQRIFAKENGSTGVANDLRDSRQSKIEELATLVNVDAGPNDEGEMEVSVNDVVLVSGIEVTDRLESFSNGTGHSLVRTQSGGTQLNLTGGSIQGYIDARDGAVVGLREDVNTLASSLINELNSLHAGGFSLTDETGADFFSGSDAASISVNSNLADNVSLIQASGSAGDHGNNEVALQMAQLADKKHAAFNNQTFHEMFGQTVADIGQALNSVESQRLDQGLVEGMLMRQRSAISGVSLDEEMTDMMRFQRAYEASARLISTIDEMLSTVVNLKR